MEGRGGEGYKKASDAGPRTAPRGVGAGGGEGSAGCFPLASSEWEFLSFGKFSE